MSEASPAHGTTTRTDCLDRAIAAASARVAFAGSGTEAVLLSVFARAPYQDSEHCGCEEAHPRVLSIRSLVHLSTLRTVAALEYVNVPYISCCNTPNKNKPVSDRLIYARLDPGGSEQFHSMLSRLARGVRSGDGGHVE